MKRSFECTCSYDQDLQTEKAAGVYFHRVPSPPMLPTVEEAQRFYNDGRTVTKVRTGTGAGQTRVIRFSRYRQGETSFEFLGFKFRRGVNRKGHAWLQRRTARKRLRNSLRRVTEWCRQNRHRRIRAQVQLLNAKLRGYQNYYGVSSNSASLDFGRSDSRNLRILSVP